MDALVFAMPFIIQSVVCNNELARLRALLVFASMHACTELLDYRWIDDNFVLPRLVAATLAYLDFPPVSGRCFSLAHWIASHRIAQLGAAAGNEPALHARGGTQFEGPRGPGLPGLPLSF